jgi:hypothetical protein
MKSVEQHILQAEFRIEHFQIEKNMQYFREIQIENFKSTTTQNFLDDETKSQSLCGSKFQI